MKRVTRPFFVAAAILLAVSTAGWLATRNNNDTGISIGSPRNSDVGLDPGEAGLREAHRTFTTALSRGDAQAACAVLTSALQTLAAVGHESCEDAYRVYIATLPPALKASLAQCGIASMRFSSDRKAASVVDCLEDLEGTMEWTYETGKWLLSG